MWKKGKIFGVERGNMFGKKVWKKGCMFGLGKGKNIWPGKREKELIICGLVTSVKRNPNSCVGFRYQSVFFVI